MAINRARTGEFIPAQIYKRIEDTDQYNVDPINFMCKIVGSFEIQSAQPIQGILMEDTSLVIKSSNLSYDPQNKDKVVILGDNEYFVQRSQVDFNAPFTMNAARFNPVYLKSRLPKYISLK